MRVIRLIGRRTVARQGAGSLLLLLLCCAAVRLKAEDQPSVFVVDDFNGGIQNELAGYRNPFEARPSWAKSRRTAGVCRGAGGKSLLIEAERRESGFCGSWIHLFDMRSDEPKYFDASGYSYLSFWIKGRQGGERLDVHLADRTWIGKEDSIRLGSVAEFLDGGVTMDWQEVVVPLDNARNLDFRELGCVTFNFSAPGKAVVYVEDLSFKQDRRAIVPEAGGPPVESLASAPMPRALWVWSSQEIVGDPSQVGQLLRFCRSERINQLWMQLTYKVQLSPAGPDGEKRHRCVITQPEQWRKLLRQAHAARINIHALDGSPEFALKENHSIPLSVVDAVIEFNRRADLPERFDGIHFDNEPYLLLGWADTEIRERILREFLALNVECQRRVRQIRGGGAGLEFGVDIPFWWQHKDKPSGECLGNVTFEGYRQAASYHCLDRLDNVGIMNYRDSADGADGMIFHGRELLAHADRTGNAKVFMGVETFAPDPAVVYFAVGMPRESFLRCVRGQGATWSILSRWHEVRLHRYDDGANVHVGIELPAGVFPDADGSLHQALLEIAQVFGTSADPAIGSRADEIQAAAAASIGKNPEWSDYFPRPIIDPRGKTAYQGFTARSVTLSKTTFAEESLAELRLQTDMAEEAFSQSKCFHGLAIHYYEPYRDKVRRGADDGAK